MSIKRLRVGAVLFAALALSMGCSHSPAQATAQTPAQAPTKQEAAAKLARETVALVSYTEEGEAHVYCSGVWVSSNHILTAAHCVRTNPFAALFGLEDETIRFSVRTDVFVDNQEAKYPTTRIAYRVRVDEDADLALLRTDDAPSHESALVSARPIVPGDFAQTMGHPKGLWWSYSAGEIAAIRFEPLGQDIPELWIQSTAPISPGNSGGGLFDEQGDLIGICSRHVASARAQNLNFFVHRDTIMKFLRAAS